MCSNALKMFCGKKAKQLFQNMYFFILQGKDCEWQRFISAIMQRMQSDALQNYRNKN